MVKITYSIDKFMDEFKQQLLGNPDPVNALEKTFYTLGKDYLLPVTEVILCGLPLGSMQASGRYRDRVFVTRKGKTHIRKYIKPPDPNSAEQLACQNKLRQVAQLWKSLSAETKQEYNERAKLLEKPMHGYDLFCSENLKK